MATKISTRLLEDSLRDAVRAVDEQREHLNRTLRERDDMIRDLLQVIPMTKVARITGLSRESLYRIKTYPPREDS